jgi:hypothetical protein
MYIVRYDFAVFHALSAEKSVGEGQQSEITSFPTADFHAVFP